MTSFNRVRLAVRCLGWGEVSSLLGVFQFSLGYEYEEVLSYLPEAEQGIY